MTNYKTFDAQNLNSIKNTGVIIDVRTDMEHAEKHIAIKHFHMPLHELNPSYFMEQNNFGKDYPVYILCRSGGRAEQAAEQFLNDGYTNIYVIEGGIISCEACGHDLDGYATNNKQKSCKTPITLERQVRIVAGAIVAIGALLSITVNVLFGIIPLMVGCGLMFAGITDRCGMALILTKAPWNNKLTNK